MEKIKQIEVLKSITGYANPGQTLYIMGSSGAGKTSLMNALSDRINTNKSNLLTGKIMVND
jgi:ABC-type multidrug transport system ATPase subunit